MALDRECKDMPYLVGRLIAITEHYAGKHFGPGTVTTMYQHPAHGLGVFRKYVDDNDEYLREIMETGVDIPITAKNEIEKGQMSLGYHHQKTLYGKRNDQERQRIGTEIATMRKAQGKTQQDIATAVGMQRAHIARIEAGRYSVGLDTLAAIGDALGKQLVFIDK